MKKSLSTSLILVLSFLSSAFSLWAQVTPDEVYPVPPDESTIATNFPAMDIPGYEVRSASRGNIPPPEARWVLGADKQFHTENAFFQAQLAEDLSSVGALRVTFPGAEKEISLLSTVLALAYCEPGENGRTAILGQIKP